MVIVDASVVFKWLVEEKPQHQIIAARKIRDSFLNGNQEILAPDILMYEIANTFAFKTKLREKDLKKGWYDFIRINVPLITPDFNLISKSIYFAEKYKTSVYDATYAILALEKNCDLITADEKFVKQVKLPFVKSLNNYSEV